MRHAYMIMAHNNFDILRKTIKMIDDVRNDIYIHIDKKVRNFDFDDFRRVPQRSRLFFTDRIRVAWGGYSQIACEYILFKAAASQHYDYYHLLSGVDMPLVSQNTIHTFFETHQGKEFVIFDKHCESGPRLERIQYYYFLSAWARSPHNTLRVVHQRVNHFSLMIQHKLKVNRLKNCNLAIRKGANWISVTDNFINYILRNEKTVKRLCQYGYCADEFFVQTLLFNSDYYKNVYSVADDDYHGIKRCIDWKRGGPYVFKEEDYDYLLHSDCFWARKIDSNESGKLADMLYKHVMIDLK